MAGAMCGLPDHVAFLFILFRLYVHLVPPFYSSCSAGSAVRSVTWLMGGLPAHVAFLFSIELLKAQKLC